MSKEAIELVERFRKQEVTLIKHDLSERDLIPTGNMTHHASTQFAMIAESHAQQQAIEFAEWIAINRWQRIFSPVLKDKVWCDVSEYEWMGEEDRLITTPSLYEQYLKEKK